MCILNSCLKSIPYYIALNEDQGNNFGEIYSQNGSSVPTKGEWMSSLSQIWFHYSFQ